MKTHVYLGIVLAFAVSALAIPSRHARGKSTRDMMDTSTTFCLKDIQYPCAPQSLINHTGYYEPDYCCPEIVPALGGKEHSVIEPIHDCSVDVAIINDWGNCSVFDKGFW